MLLLFDGEGCYKKVGAINAYSSFTRQMITLIEMCSVLTVSLQMQHLIATTDFLF